MIWTRWWERWRWRHGSRDPALHDLATTFALAEDFPALRAVIARRLREVAGGEAALFCEYHPVRRAYVPTAGDRIDPDSCADIAIHLDGPLVKWLGVNQEAMGHPDPRGAHDFLGPEERAAFDAHRVRLCLPLISVNRLLGIALVVSSTPLALRGDRIAFLTACGRQAGLACEAAGRRGQELHRLRSEQHAARLAIAGRLAAAVAHEVRNPLTVIRSTMQLILEVDWPWEQKRALLQSVMEEVDRIDGTVGRLLHLSRPAEIECVEVDMNAVAEEAVAFAQAYGAGAGVTLVRKSTRRPLRVTGDPRELRSVLLNLLLNACQAMDAGGVVTVRTDLVTRPRSDGTLQALTVVEIGDTGPGMAPDVLARVFDPFFTTKATGTGLGLPASLEIVQRHGGELRLASEPGRGTLATVLIPAGSVD
jgi:signal transduction histidine kinase